MAIVELVGAVEAGSPEPEESKESEAAEDKS
jgi:hypothetical protein